MRNYSFESIAVQTGKLHDKISEAVTEIRADGSYTTESIKKSMLSQIIKRETGLNVLINIKKRYGINASVWLPLLDNNHPFISTYLGGTGYTAFNSSGADAIDLLEKNNIAGKVDTKNCTVSGAFSKYETSIIVGYELISNVKFTAREVSAIILHELGHLFTYYQFMGASVHGAVITGLIAKNVMETQDYDTRIKIIKKAQAHLGIEGIDAEKYASNGGKGLDVVLLTQYARRIYNATSHANYDVRNTEQLADTFATRHGAGVDLATGLNKLYIHYGDRSTYSMTTHVFVELMKLTLWLLTLLALPLVAIVILIYSSPMQFKIYDDDKARITFIKQQLITELKNPKLSDAHRKEVNDDLLTIEAVESELNSRRTLYQVLWQNLTSSGRNQAKQEEYEKKLEALMYTDIYTRASQLKQIQTTE